MTSCLWLVCTLIAIIGSAYALLAATLVARFAAGSKALLQNPEDVTLLKPLHGAEAALAPNLESFCAQNYAADIQVVCGVQDPHDPAILFVQNLRAQFPNRDIRLAIGSKPNARNPKISNILNMMSETSCDILILSDSDMSVRPDYVSDVVAALQQPGVGLVTCLYRGSAAGGFWSRLAAAAVDQHFLPNVLVGLQFGLAHPCFGSTIALRRETLRRIGGFEAFADALADDYEMGEAVRRLGLKVAIPPFTIGHTFSDASFTELISHELRWARTIRLVDPMGYVGSIVTHPLPFALAALPLSGFSAIAVMILAATLASRLFVPIQVERLPGGGKRSLWLSPLRDLVSFAVFVASFVPGAVSWRGRRYSVESDGSVTPL
ncbi:hopanoid biosynthesis associated glycosyl transferase protein HpnI [Hyphomicrobium denitrificans 1NES1]|uniref:Hopanoid biosynthesis associated glycosyl transferase protein HpnI n=1 Tax=Hyphomicrobium denitrificans 1NES1 TaxID=670307 RepID=N0B156_9HYPH|nr:bacteriohopanetetrol glucosamine biosynthesis glycosyltransferase HpnI [Hyphomicrobium denitrificans]AGK56668.1 hopanoid biosynthesis associated glycosyl transferase protein HpnI [Hyphomicrobium denitrificans 1NES1]